jgi:hypothetical protein
MYNTSKDSSTEALKLLARSVACPLAFQFEKSRNVEVFLRMEPCDKQRAMFRFWVAENVVAIENHRCMQGGVYVD